MVQPLHFQGGGSVIRHLAFFVWLRPPFASSALNLSLITHASQRAGHSVMMVGAKGSGLSESRRESETQRARAQVVLGLQGLPRLDETQAGGG